MRPSAAARSRSSSVRMPSSRYSVATVLGPTPCRCSRSRMVGGNSATQLAVVRGVAGLARSRRIRAARSLPMPGISRRPASSSARELVRMVGGDVGAVAVRANLERVVVLDLQEVGDLPEDARDRQVIQAAGLRSRCGSRAGARRRRRAPRRSPVARVGRAVAEQTAAAAGAADLGGRGAGRGRARDQVVDGRRRDAGRQPLAVVPFDGDLPADLVPVAALRAPSRIADRGVADPLEAVEDVRGRRRCGAW